MNQSEHELRRQNALAYWERRRKENASIGWHEILDEVECKDLFDRLQTLNPSDQPNVPSPSTTWDVSASTGMRYRSPEQLAVIDDLHLKCLHALKRCSDAGKTWYVFENCQHPCYELYVDEMPDHVDNWPVQILPYADPCYLLASDSSSGIIAVLRKSITVFGSPLLSYINQDLPVAFTRIVHSAGP